MQRRWLVAATCGVLLAAAAGATKADVDQLDWLAGHWCSGAGDDRIEEYWLPAAGGALLGVSRTLRGGRMTEFEFLRIATEKGVLTYLPQPGGRPAVAFARSAGGAKWIRFENREHDFPQVIEYRRDGHALRAQIAGPGEGGREAVIRFDFHSCARGS